MTAFKLLTWESVHLMVLFLGVKYIRMKFPFALRILIPFQIFLSLFFPSGEWLSVG